MNSKYSRISFLLAGLFLALSAAAQTILPGVTVRLVERDPHIPAHPNAGNPSIHLRFESGSTATVLAHDTATDWFKLDGQPLAGSQTVGWVLRKYISEVIDDAPDDSVLDWSIPKGSPNPHPSGRLRIASWNLGNLHSQNGESTFAGGGDPSVKRFAADYQRIKMYIRLFDPDILAVQEVDGAAALGRVVDPDVYSVHVSSRVKPADMNGRQNTGFAYKKGFDVTPQPDFEALDVHHDGKLRFGARIDLTFHGTTIKLMSVHLKSGCFDDNSTSSACTTLAAQIPVLESWIDAAAVQPEPFIVLGDFNRRFNTPNDTVWAALDDGQPANSDLTTITMDMPICCRDNQFTRFIDHIVFDKRSIQWADVTSFRHVTFRQQDREDWDKISDHCPVMVELWIP